ncbi:riboflavin biosynthesis protein RibF [Fructilactobacillus myrtifloralis]|uniref:Riboflavin biosynthesis protein n=1 Tax=Fructilactobacillus myrtifloralis TaxID=2940301 RepID=A0ABY5BP34_9LACO|nr:riboflavin biosynthesis protein RibF [Fructilactobacillus myrtifloralis]USS85422.1 riboflavin biosynthesis protein RibF [Fructilactobacillus myrtifloralis]
MQIMQLTYPLAPDLEFPTPVVLAMGFFDGVHQGHQQVIERARHLAAQRNLPLAVLTYDHHPALVYQKLTGDAARYLTLKTAKYERFAALGVDYVYEVNYDYLFQAQTPQEFVDNFIIRMQAQVVVAGFDHTYGEREAAMDNLTDYAQDRFTVVTVPATTVDGKKVSSTRIRRNLSAGHIETVNRLLQRPFQITGTVVHGFARGRTLGYPTANVQYDDLQRMPGLGVYLVKMQINDHWYPAMASIGKNVTFGDQNPVTLEVHLFDFNQNLYGKQVAVQFLTKTRDEVKYQGPEALVAQLRRDEQEARKFFKLERNS